MGAFLLMSAEFYNNSLKIVNQDFFDWFQKDSESLSVGRLLRSDKEGPFSHGGFLGWNHPFQPSWPKDSIPPHLRFDGWGYIVPGFPSKYFYQYNALQSDLKINDYELYFSQTGGQSFIYYLLSVGFQIPAEKLVSFCRMLNAAFTALVLCCFFGWAKRTVGNIPSFLCFLMILVSQWPIVFANNMLYVTGLFYLPMVLNLLYLDHCRKSQKLNPKIVLLITFFTVFIKCAIAGFDFIIPTLVMVSIPVIIYGYLDNWNKKAAFKLFSLNAAFSILAVCGALVLLVSQLAIFHHSWKTAFDYIVNTSERRTYGNQIDLKDVYNVSLHSSLLDVWNIYANAVVISIENAVIPVVIKMKYFLWAFLLAAFFVPYSVDKHKKTLISLLIATGISLSGPLGWFIIFRFHAISHTHMNFIIWYMPLMLFGSLLIGCIMKMGFELLLKTRHSETINS